AALEHRLVQAGANIVKNNYDAAVIAEQNTITNRIVQGFVDPSLGLEYFTTAGITHVDLILDASKRLRLDVQVSQV
ncbi:MAG: hypothetical protein HY811_06300, partial [Planctomycetes bacterium]|nr:hypothetical protein [Planctomycetota bacterium]